jgi:branched-subunit amino acid transport protein
MNAWFIVIVAGIGSYLLRLSMIITTDRFRMPARLDETSVLVAPAAFAALAATSIAGTTLEAGPSGALAPVAAVAVAVLAVMRTGSPHAALLAGMPTLWLINAAVSA